MSAKGSILLDLTPFKVSGAFTRMWIGAAVTGIGNALTGVAVGLHIYHLTGSTFAVSMVGVVALLPTVASGLWGGALVDHADRRLVALGAAILAWTSTAAIALLAWTGHESIWTLYIFSAITSVGATLVSAARNAIIPSLIPPETLPAAAALNGISMGLVITLGPTLAGLLVAQAGYAWTYTVDLIMFCSSFLGLWTLPPMRPQRRAGSRPGWRAIREALSFLRGSPVVGMSFVVDIIAMTFGNPRSLFPAVAAVAIGGGPITAGLLGAASAIGALVCSLFSGRIVRAQRHGRAVNISVIIYGAFTVGLGVVIALALAGRFAGAPGTPNHTSWPAMIAASAMLVGQGASDNVSAIFRNTILQQAVPDSIRGRMQGIYVVVVTGGPRIGDLFVGLLAIAAVWAPPVIGGLAIISLVAMLIRLVPSFQRYDAGGA